MHYTQTWPANERLESRAKLSYSSTTLVGTKPSEPRMPAIDITAVARKIIANVEKVIIGKRQQIILALVAWFCEGHILLEDVPGVAKTMLARALAKSVGCAFKRIQCTPDLLPTDVTGASIFNQKTAEFEFRPGPDLRPDRAGRRDQPRHAAHAGGPAGSDGRGPRDASTA